MSGLIETMKIMHQLLRGEKTPEEIADIFGADPKRLAVYQNFVYHHIVKALAKNFSTFRSLLDVSTWNDLVDEYFKFYPAHVWELNACTKEFPNFIAQKIEKGFLDGQTFYLELLQFEWEEVNAYCNEIVIPKSSEIETPILNPTLTILNLEYPVGQFLSLWRQGKREDEWITNKLYLQQQAEVAFIFRHPKKHRCFFYTANDRLLFAFKIVHDNIDIETASQLSGQSMDAILDVMFDVEDTGIIVMPMRLRRTDN